MRNTRSPSSAESSSSGPRIKIDPDAEDLTRAFEGLNVENDGRVSFHGPTSLFQLPSGLVSGTTPTSHYTEELEGRKERLVNSAWRERAFEQMAAMPVWVLVDYIVQGMHMLIQSCRSLSSIFSTRIGAGSSRCGILSTVLHLHVCSTLSFQTYDTNLSNR